MPSIRGVLSLAVLLLLVLAPVGARAGDGAKLLRYLPEGTEMVAVMDVAGMRKRPLVKDWVNRLGGEDWKQKVAAAGVDPLRDVDTVLIATALGGDDTFKLAIAEGRFPADVASRLAQGSREEKHGKVSYWVDGDSAGALVGKRLVMAPAARMPAAIDLVSGRAGGRLAKAAPLRTVIGATDTRHHVWVAMVMTGDLRQKVGEVGADAQGVIMAASAGRDLRLELRVLFVDEATAVARLDQLRVALPQATGAIAAFGFAAAASTLASDREGSTVRVTATVSPTELTTLGEVVGGLAPAAPSP
jgi:hypothetical protein